ncbi:hypothetical protein XBKB1_1280016 [Xenorhabdus bovienii str. kraussei Becker Underwood]|uniref:Uncharacterized protein n=1 Tax=Xenorhabdus bovienii str. kraussei Becker Underwood TaxID=1398204 RepID=A0A077PPI1_XENBV|nr:hypothetical protein XBKB1_1280016 [Xenorhabdus bovienii str. kraussei Becker Underwood]
MTQELNVTDITFNKKTLIIFIIKYVIKIIYFSQLKSTN